MAGGFYRPTFPLRVNINTLELSASTFKPPEHGMAMAKLNDTVVAYSNLKEAALYFDHVIPDPTYIIDTVFREGIRRGEVGKDFLDEAVAFATSEFGSDTELLLPPELLADKQYFTLARKVPVWLVLNAVVKGYRDDPRFSVEAAKESINQVNSALGVSMLHNRALEASANALHAKYPGDLLPVVIPDDWVTIPEYIQSTIVSDDVHPEYRLGLVGANFVDTDHASWDQIHEFREDGDSRKKLARLRRFLDGEYEGKSEAFIAEDLYRRMETHDQIAKKFGFDVKSSIFEAVLNSETLQNIIVGATGFAAFFGRPMEAMAVGAVSTLYEVGKAKVTLERKRFEFNQIVEKNPLGYIVKANDDLKPTKP